MSSSREGQGKVKNRAPAPVQITAEQLLREAADFQGKLAPVPKQRVEDFEELQEYRARKRKEFEEVIRRTRSNLGAWTKYANWEASQTEFPRYVRSHYSSLLYPPAVSVRPSLLARRGQR